MNILVSNSRTVIRNLFWPTNMELNRMERIRLISLYLKATRTRLLNGFRIIDT